jgi:hypothetical protein
METAPAKSGRSRPGELFLRFPGLREARIAELEALYAAARAEVERLEPGEEAQGMARVEYVQARNRARAILSSLKWLRALRKGKLAYVLSSGLYDSIGICIVMPLGLQLLFGDLGLFSVELWRGNLFLLPLLLASIFLQGVLSWKYAERDYASLSAREMESG